ncbi:DoxX family protein [Demequina sp. SYSU T00039]|uniref:DoxX family protein n=1 Tax=Demequina lignilytica TaxID=3051663 RepID=A0AAW7M8J9_9MICO|nr:MULTISPECIES: DoxX family protein [unclassified Demequina]MDN4478407.1 DoxX family protein [Demequina sp. SYSU T00039-1]MDN4487086.1 DoxX family protein [Demequina sp. SYSU T00039]MDN4489797.1 DoxX family protein [Demequina sp. SYSU T00068]
MADTVQTAEAAVVTRSKVGWTLLSVTRIALGFYFLWAFLDKLLGLGYSVCRTVAEDGTFTIDAFCERAWVNGGSVTEGYLVYGGNVNSPFHEFFVNLGAERWTDWPFMLGLAGVGVALMLGIGTKIGAWSAGLMLFFMYLTQMPTVTNPILDEHLIYILAIAAIVLVEKERQSVGLGRWWRSLPVVQKNGWLV